MLRNVVVACLLAAVAAKPVVELNAANYAEMTEGGGAYLIEVFSGMCESCKAYEKVWHQLEGKLVPAPIGLGRINMDDGEGAALAGKFDDLLDNGIPAVLWVADPVNKPFEYKLVDDGSAKSGKRLWDKLKKAAPEAKDMIVPAKKEL